MVTSASRRCTHLIVAAALAAVVYQPAAAAGKYQCGNRELTAAETADVTRVLDSMRKALPAAPAGWTLRGDDGAADCGDVPRPVPVNITYTRSYLKTGAAASSQDEQARLAELDKNLAALKAEEQEVIAKYNEARSTRDPAILQPLQQKMRDLRMQQTSVVREQAALRMAIQRKALEQRNAQSAAAENESNIGRLTITTNRSEFGRVYPDSKRIMVAGVPLAIQDARGDGLVVTQLFFGRSTPSTPPGPQPTKVALDAAAPITRVQNLIVRIDGTAESTEQLLKGIDVATLKAIVAP